MLNFLSFLGLLYISGHFKQKNLFKFFLTDRKFLTRHQYMMFICQYLNFLLHPGLIKRLLLPLQGLGPSLGLFLPSQGLALARQCIILKVLSSIGALGCTEAFKHRGKEATIMTETEGGSTIET